MNFASQPGEAVAGAVGQQCLAGQHRRHHALLFKNKALLEQKRWGEVGGKGGVK